MYNLKKKLQQQLEGDMGQREDSIWSLDVIHWYLRNCIHYTFFFFLAREDCIVVKGKGFVVKQWEQILNKTLNHPKTQVLYLSYIYHVYHTVSR